MTSSAPIEVLQQAGADVARVVRRVLSRVALPRRDGFWLVVQLSASPEELRAPFSPFGQRPAPSLVELLEILDAARRDPQVDGVLLRISGPLHGISRVLSLRRAVQAFRAAGKPVAVYAETLEAESLLLASAASAIWLPETGNVFLVGLRLESMFLRGVLERLDLKPEVVRIGRYKSAAERLTRDAMSPENREQLEALADDLYDELVAGIANGRGLSHSKVRELVDKGPYGARAAVAVGLADACLYPDEIDRALEALTPVPPAERPGPRRVRRVDSSVYAAMRVDAAGPLFARVPRIAYVVASGTIGRGAGLRGIRSDRYRELFDALARDRGVRGVVLRVDSGGGDALASDLLWRAISLVRREKPVVVSMGDVVASGGYYMAAAADEVVAEPCSVTGSIGVVGGKLNLEGLYRRVGVSKQGVERGARAGLLSESRGFTPDERHAVQREMAELYDTFVDRVAEGRGLTRAEIEKVAQGRIWSGARAQKFGLVDTLGGPLEALQTVRRRAGLRDGEPVRVDHYPHSPKFPSLREILRFTPFG
ncbi:MAG: signal peptide peptidase SppA [Deltaproteobacteria bacterium]|nr:signal peptide peptidase SppA [Deltaproteobacteria bacterium]